MKLLITILKKSQYKFLICLLLFNLIFSSDCFSREKKTYKMNGSLVTELIDDNNLLYFDFWFKNKSNKKVSKIVITVYYSSFIDDDTISENIEWKKYDKIIEIQEKIDYGEELKNKYLLSIQDYSENESDLTEYNIDFIYVNEIVYEDGSIWKK